jgi:hypothetical protein
MHDMLAISIYVAFFLSVFVVALVVILMMGRKRGT